MTKRRPLVPKAEELPGSHCDAEPEYLCANWRQGCNGATDGPSNGRLTYCDYCEADNYTGYEVNTERLLAALKEGDN